MSLSTSRRAGAHAAIASAPQIKTSSASVEEIEAAQASAIKKSWRMCWKLMVFKDLVGTNLARKGHATQSSTAYGGSAHKAIDGVTDGKYSALSTTHTGGHGDGDPQPWWQVKLAIDDSTPVGTVRLWNREQEDNLNEIQIIQTTTLAVVDEKMVYTSGHVYDGATKARLAGVSIGSCASLAGNNNYKGGLLQKLHQQGLTADEEGTGDCGDDTFTLLIPFGAVGSTPCTTAPIHFSAVARILDESRGSLLQEIGRAHV